jgi:hypothetical protein
MVISPEGLGPENDCVAEAQRRFETTDSSSRRIECPSSIIPQMSDSNKNLVLGPRLVKGTKTDWPTGHRS